MGYCFQRFFYKFRKSKECKSLLRVLLAFFFFSFFFLQDLFFKLHGLGFFSVIYAEDNEKNLSYLLVISTEQKFAKSRKDS